MADPEFKDRALKKVYGIRGEGPLEEETAERNLSGDICKLHKYPPSLTYS